jgi:hypothetical protein
VMDSTAAFIKPWFLDSGNVSELSWARMPLLIQNRLKPTNIVFNKLPCRRVVFLFIYPPKLFG